MYSCVSAGENEPLMFGRDPTDNCPQILQCRESCDPFEANKIVALHDETFVAQIGPSALDRGYTGITGMIALWSRSPSLGGIAWCINITKYNYISRILLGTSTPRHYNYVGRPAWGIAWYINAQIIIDIIIM